MLLLPNLKKKKKERKVKIKKTAFIMSGEMSVIIKAIREEDRSPVTIEVATKAEEEDIATATTTITIVDMNAEGPPIEAPATKATITKEAAEGAITAAEAATIRNNTSWESFMRIQTRTFKAR